MLTACLAVLTVLVLLVPQTRIAVVSLNVRVAVEVAMVWAMGTAALLLAVLQQQASAGIGRDAFVAALIVQALANVAFGVVPALLGETPTFERSFYPWLTGRYIAGVLFLAAAIHARPRRLRDTVLVSVVLMAIVETVVRAAVPQLPLPPDVAPGEIAPFGAHVMLEAVPLVLFALGAVVAAGSASQTDEPLERWLSLALLTGVFTQIHQALFPAALGEVLTSADVLRAVSAGLLLIGAVSQVVRLQQQRIRALTLLQEDLARNQRLLAQVRDAKEREEAFASVVTHELSSPLAAINAHVHVLDLLAEESQRPHVAAVRTEAERLGGLVRRMDELRTLEQQDFAVDLRPVAVEPLLQEIAAFARGLPGGHAIEVDATPARINVDPVRLGQVLRNLASNATRYAPEGTNVRLLGHHGEEGHYELLVCDEGPGVAKEYVDDLFNPYVRGEAAGDRDGTGLGLHIARRIIEAHRGTIEFVDVDEPGARVRVTVEVAT